MRQSMQAADRGLRGCSIHSIYNTRVQLKSGNPGLGEGTEAVEIDMLLYEGSINALNVLQARS